METTAIAQISERVSIKNFMKKEGYTSFFKSVRYNTNGLPYVTFLSPTGDGKTSAENIYFSQTLSDEVTEGTDVLDLFRSGTVKVAEITYKDGRPTRWKLVSAESGGYVSIDDLD